MNFPHGDRLTRNERSPVSIFLKRGLRLLKIKQVQLVLESRVRLIQGTIDDLLTRSPMRLVVSWFFTLLTMIGEVEVTQNY